MKLRAKSRTGMVTTTIAFDPKTHKRLALASLEDRKAINVIVREAVDLWLKRRSAGRKGGNR